MVSLSTTFALLVYFVLIAAGRVTFGTAAGIAILGALGTSFGLLELNLSSATMVELHSIGIRFGISVRVVRKDEDATILSMHVPSPSDSPRPGAAAPTAADETKPGPISATAS